jgi:cbb3-type cytochrome oxidase subunit 3
MLITLVLVPVIYSLFEEKVRRTKRFEEAKRGEQH